METDSGPVKPTVWVIISPNTSVWKPHHSLRSGERSFLPQTRVQGFIDAPTEIISWITERWKIQSEHCPNSSNTQRQSNRFQTRCCRRKNAPQRGLKMVFREWAKTPAVASLPLSTHVCTYAGPPTCTVGACCKTTAACFLQVKHGTTHVILPPDIITQCFGAQNCLPHKVGQCECCFSSVAWQHLSSFNLQVIRKLLQSGIEIFRLLVALIFETERLLNRSGLSGLMSTHSLFLYCFTFRRLLTASVLGKNICSSSAWRLPLMFDIWGDSVSFASDTLFAWSSPRRQREAE